MTATESLWPTFSLEELERSPKTILKEQAVFFSKSTRNILTATIRTSPYLGGTFEHEFKIVAPQLNGYKYTLLTIHQKGVFSYPCSLYFEDSSYDLSNEDELLFRLREIFSSDLTKKIVSNLIAQSKDEVSDII